MRLQFLLILFCSGFVVFSQDMDEIVHAYQSGATDQKMEVLFENYSELEGLNKDSILYFIKDLQSIGIAQQREDAIAMSNYYFGHFLNDNGLLDEAKRKINEALKYYKFAENDTMLAAGYNALGNTEYLGGNYGGAEEYYLKSYEFGKKSGIEKFKSLSYANLSRI